MSLLSIIQNVCAELSLDIPGLVVGSPDPTTLQLKILSQRAGDDLCRDNAWSILRVLRSFTSTGAAFEPSEPPADFQTFADNFSIWNNSRLWTLNGPVDSQTWQRNTVIHTNPVPQIWRMQSGKLAIYPNVAGETISYEYMSTAWIASGATNVTTWTADTDTSLFPERLVELSLLWRWKRAKGLDYGEEMESFQRARESEVGSDRAATATSLNKPNRGQIPDNYWPGIITVGP